MGTGELPWKGWGVTLRRFDFEYEGVTSVRRWMKYWGGGITWLKCRPYLENLQVKLHESLGRIHLCWSFAFVLLWSIKWVTE